MNEVNAQTTLHALKRAVDLDANGRFTEALLCYQEGVHLTDDIIKAGKNDVTESAMRPLRAKKETYVSRIDKLKTTIAQAKERGYYSESFIIEDGSIGYSYESLFGRFLDDEIRIIVIEDPYIRNFVQCQNFLRLCELFIRKCLSLQRVVLITSKAESGEGCQGDWFRHIRNELNKRRIILTIKYSFVFEGPKIRFSNGWIIKICRGLDIYKSLDDRLSLGAYDYDLRPCYEAQLDIFYTKNFTPLRNLYREHVFLNYVTLIFAML